MSDEKNNHLVTAASVLMLGGWTATVILWSPYLSQYFPH